MKVSYIISAYKAEKFLEGRLKNLLIDQSEKDIEVIVVDSASPENEKAICDKFADNRLIYIRQDKRTPYGVSWLDGWKIAKGEFVCNANADDLVDPKFTEICYQEFIRAIFQNSLLRWNKKIGFAYTGIAVYDENNVLKGAGIKPPFDFDRMSYQCEAGPCVLWRNDTEFRQSLDWNLMYSMAEEYTSAFDYSLWLYFMSLGYCGLSIQKILTYYLQRSDSIENSDKKLNNYQTYCAISRFFSHNFDTYLKHAIEFRDYSNRPSWNDWR